MSTQASRSPSRSRSNPPQNLPSMRSLDSYSGVFNPDVALPSVERETSFLPSGPSSKSASPIFTPLTSPRRSTSRQTEGNGVLSGALNELRLNSPAQAAPVRATPGPSGLLRRRSSDYSPTPSIRLTSSPSSPPSDTFRADSLVNAVEAIRLNANDRTSASHLDTPSPEEARSSRSPTTSRRRRSGSSTQVVHLVENEEPAPSLFHTREIQDALVSTRDLTTRIVNALSSSALHHEQGSSIHSLHQRALALNAFQLPSTRIVGLVGDSGVGKSSLINSLLDVAELARAVS